MSIELRKIEFKQNLETRRFKYPEIIDEFFEYWSEHGEKDRKMRYEKEKTWNTELRLKRWLKNDIKWNRKKERDISNL